MTFSAETKLELARYLPPKPCCRRSELAGILRAELSPAEYAGAGPLTIPLGHPALARKLYTLIKEITPAADVRVVRQRPRVKRRSFTLQVTEGAAPLLAALGEVLPGGLLGDDIPQARCCRRSYLRGAFLARGSISAPAKHYHIEIVVDAQRVACSLVACFEALGLDARTSRRKGAHLVYLKESEGIVAALNLMGAHNALLELENVRIVKGMRNRVNRLVNCETANVDKTVNASMEQLDAIRLIDEAHGLARLPPSLQALARARLEHPYASLRELGETLDPPVSKSGVNYRMKRLLAMAAQLPGSQVVKEEEDSTIPPRTLLR